MQEKKTLYSGWIPTNKGEIEFNYIELPSFIKATQPDSVSHTVSSKKYKNLDVSYLSDSYGYKKYIKHNTEKSTEVPIIASVSFENKDNCIDGSLEIEYKDFANIKSRFEILSNGVVNFYTLEAATDINDFEKEIQALIYVLVKTIVHGDAYHHQKIDVALATVDGEFDPKVVLKSFLDYIKLAEKNTKKTNDCESILRNENIVYEIEGYFSYFKSFVELFECDEIKKDLAFAQNIVNSLKSTVEKRKNKVSFTTSIITTSIAFLGVLISINILLNGFWTIEKNDITFTLSEQSRYLYFVVSFAFVSLAFFYVTKCKLKSYIYYNYYENFEFVRLLNNASFMNLNWYGKMLKYLPFGLIACGVVLFYLSVKYQ